MKITTKDLSEEATKDLQMQLKTMPIGALIVAGVLAYVAHNIYNACFVRNESWEQNMGSIICGSCLLLLLIAFIPMFVVAKKASEAGKIEVITGVLTQKSTSLTHQGYRHHFHFGEYIIDLGEENTEDTYNWIKVGQNLAIERIKHTEAILKIEVLAENE